MGLIPFNNSVMGKEVEYRTFDEEFEAEVKSTLDLWRPGDSYQFDHGKAAILSQLGEKTVIPFMVEVTALGPDTTELTVGDIAILQRDGATQISVTNTETGDMEWVWVVPEHSVLAVWRDDADS